jgi:hypothetical protein
LLSDLLDRIINSFADASSLTVGVSASVAGLTPERFSASERSTVAARLDEFYNSLTRLNLTHEQAVDDLDDYARSVRNNGFVAQTHEQMWADIKHDLKRLAEIVAVTRRMEQDAVWMSSTLSPTQQHELDRVLIGKANMLQQLSTLPAPRTPSEIDKLTALKVRFQDLLERQQALKAELARARARFV